MMFTSPSSAFLKVRAWPFLGVIAELFMHADQRFDIQHGCEQAFDVADAAAVDEIF